LIRRQLTIEVVNKEECVLGPELNFDVSYVKYTVTISLHLVDKLLNTTFPMADILCESQSFAPSYDPLLELLMGTAACGARAARNAFDAEITSFGF
jgi:hypothetical protein